MKSRIQLVVFDMEGTLTTDPTVWEIMHLKNGTWESHGLPYWEDYKAGGMRYDEFARKDVAAWRGTTAASLDEAVAEAPLMPGCAELLGFLRRRGIATAIVSNGLERLGLRLAREFGVGRVLANRAIVDDGHLTGGLELLVPFAGKGDALLRIASEAGIARERILAVGDGAADVAMFRQAGQSVAIAPDDQAVADAADYVLEAPDLTPLIPLIERMAE